jgi:hypothetical protein
MAEKKKPASKTIKADGEPHRVYKERDGDIVVDHVKKKGGKYDKINLTEKAKAKTLDQGVKAVKDWHSKDDKKDKKKKK